MGGAKVNAECYCWRGGCGRGFRTDIYFYWCDVYEVFSCYNDADNRFLLLYDVDTVFCCDVVSVVRVTLSSPLFTPLTPFSNSSSVLLRI